MFDKLELFWIEIELEKVVPGAEGDAHNLPQPELDNTFKRYIGYVRDRVQGKMKWNEYTPYEMRTIGTFNFSGQTDIAWELIQYFMVYECLSDYGGNYVGNHDSNYEGA